MALLAMALRALTPAGYMLAPAQFDGRIVAVTLCTDHGPVDTIIDRTTGLPADQQGGDAPSGETAAAPCVFAAAGAPLAPEAPALPNRVRSASLALAAPLAPAPRAARLAAPPPWATGPPLSA